MSFQTLDAWNNGASLTTVFKLLSKCPKKGISSARIHIPDTLFYEHGTLQCWYRYDPDTNEIIRKDRRECSHEMIYEALGLEGKGIDASLRGGTVATMVSGGYNINFPDVPVAMLLTSRPIIPGYVPGDPRTEPENHRLRRDARRRARAGQNVIHRHSVPLDLVDDDEESDVDSDDSRGGVSQPQPVIAETFLDRAGLDAFLNGNDLKHHSLLQKYPLQRAMHATTVEAVYTPQLIHITQRQNKHMLSDPAVSLYERCSTSESTPQHVETITLSTDARLLIENDCRAISEHIYAVEHRCVSRMVAYFSFETCQPNLLFDEVGGVKPLLLWVSELQLSREIPREAIKRTLAANCDRHLIHLQPQVVPGIPIGPGQRKKRQEYLLEREKYLPFAAKVGSPSVMQGRGGTDRILSSVKDLEYIKMCATLEQFRTPELRQKFVHGSNFKRKGGSRPGSGKNRKDMISSLHPNMMMTGDSLFGDTNSGDDEEEDSGSSYEDEDDTNYYSTSSGSGRHNNLQAPTNTWSASPFAHLLHKANRKSKRSSEDKLKKIVISGHTAANFGQVSRLLSPSKDDLKKGHHSPSRNTLTHYNQHHHYTSTTPTPTTSSSSAATTPLSLSAITQHNTSSPQQSVSPSHQQNNNMLVSATTPTPARSSTPKQTTAMKHLQRSVQLDEVANKLFKQAKGFKTRREIEEFHQNALLEQKRRKNQQHQQEEHNISEQQQQQQHPHHAHFNLGEEQEHHDDIFTESVDNLRQQHPSPDHQQQTDENEDSIRTPPDAKRNSLPFSSFTFGTSSQNEEENNKQQQQQQQDTTTPAKKVSVQTPPSSSRGSGRTQRPTSAGSKTGSSPPNSRPSSSSTHRHSTNSARRTSSNVVGASRGGSDVIDCRPLKRRDSAHQELKAALAAAKMKSTELAKTRSTTSVPGESPKDRRSRAGSSGRKRFGDHEKPTIDAELFCTLNGVKLHEKSIQLIHSIHSPKWLKCLSPDVVLYLHQQLSALDAATEWLNHLAYCFENTAKRAEEIQQEQMYQSGQGGSGAGAANPYKQLPDVPVNVDIGIFPAPQAVRRCPLTLQEILVSPPKIYMFGVWRIILFPAGIDGAAAAVATKASVAAQNPFRVGGSYRGNRNAPSGKKTLGGAGLSFLSENTGDLFGGMGAAISTLGVDAVRRKSSVSPEKSLMGASTTTITSSTDQHDNSQHDSQHEQHDGDSQHQHGMFLQPSFSVGSSSSAAFSLSPHSHSTSPSHSPTKKKRKPYHRPGYLITQQELVVDDYIRPYTIDSATVSHILGSATGKEHANIASNIDSWTLSGVEEERHQSRLLDTPVMHLNAVQMLSTPYTTQRFNVFSPRSNNFVVPLPVGGGTTTVPCTSIKDCRDRAAAIRQLSRIAMTTRRYVLFETIGTALKKAASFGKKMHLSAITAEAQLAGSDPAIGDDKKRSGAFMAAAVRLFRGAPPIRIQNNSPIKTSSSSAAGKTKSAFGSPNSDSISVGPGNLEQQNSAGSIFSIQRTSSTRQQHQLNKSQNSQSQNDEMNSTINSVNINISDDAETKSEQSEQSQQGNERENRSGGGGKQDKGSVSVFSDPGRMIRRYFSEVPCALSAPATWGPELIELQLRFSGAEPSSPKINNGNGDNTGSGGGGGGKTEEQMIPANPNEVAPIAKQLQAACEKFTVDLKMEVLKMLRVACMPNYLADIPPDVSEELLLLDATSKMKRPTNRSRLTPEQQQEMFTSTMKAIEAETMQVKTRKQNPALAPVNPAVEDWPPRGLVLRPEPLPEGLC